MSKPISFDVVIVGSGPAGVHATYSLVEAGLKVAMIDASNFKGDLAIRPKNAVAQSFSKGGFSNDWFGLSDFFDKKELKACGLPIVSMYKEYKEVSRRIGLVMTPQLGRQGASLVQEPGFYTLPIAWNYRTSKEVDKFRKKKSFTYIPELVREVRGLKDRVEIKADKTYSARYVILAAGAVNTTRILLRSLNKYNKKVSLLTKPNVILLCLNLRQLPKDFSPDAHGQVGLLGSADAKSFKRYFVQFYEPSTQRQPLVKLFGGRLLAADIRFPGIPSSNKYCILRNDKDGDFLEVSFSKTKNEKGIEKKIISDLKGFARSLKLIPIKTLQGTSNHFSGASTLKMKRVYIADSAGWKFLPAKPHTLTIMANASRVGKQVLRNFIH